MCSQLLYEAAKKEQTNKKKVEGGGILSFVGRMCAKKKKKGTGSDVNSISLHVMRTNCKKKKMTSEKTKQTSQKIKKEKQWSSHHIKEVHKNHNETMRPDGINQRERERASAKDVNKGEANSPWRCESMRRWIDVESPMPPARRAKNHNNNTHTHTHKAKHKAATWENLKVKPKKKILSIPSVVRFLNVNFTSLTLRHSPKTKTNPQEESSLSRGLIFSPRKQRKKRNRSNVDNAANEQHRL